MNEYSKRKLYVVAGPTAVGKTKFSIELAKKINGEIISLDSIQVYKGLDIGSNKITNEEMQNIPHYMIDIIEPYEKFNIKDFKDMTYKYINDIYERNHIPILVGGTGFYIDAILYDTNFEEEDENTKNIIRESLYNDIEKYGIDYIYNKLAEVDPKSCSIIHKNNIKRVVRAYEYYLLNGKTISSHNEIQKMKESPFDFVFYLLEKDRKRLYNDIDKRVDDMIEKGLIDEIKNLINKGVKETDQSVQAIGYKELYRYVYNNSTDKNELSNIIQNIKMHTRQYAKRQITWFKNEKNINIIKV